MEVAGGELPAQFEKVVWLTEGPINTPEYYQLGKAMEGEVDVAFNGHAGDVLGGRWLSGTIARARDLQPVVSETFTRYSRRLGDHPPNMLFSNRYYPLLQGAAKRNFDASFADLASEAPAHAQLKQEMRTKNWREYTRVNDVPRLFVRYRYPFFDYGVLDFFLKLPTSMRLHERVYLGVLIHKFPRLAQVPYPNRKYSLRAEYHYLGAYYRLRNKAGHFLVDKFYRSLSRIAPSSAVGDIDAAYLEPARSRVLNQVFETNQQQMYFNNSYVQTLIAAHSQGHADHSFLLHKLVTFDLYNRLLVLPAQLGPLGDDFV